MGELTLEEQGLKHFLGDELPKPSSPSFALADCSQIGMLGVRYTPVNVAPKLISHNVLNKWF